VRCSANQRSDYNMEYVYAALILNESNAEINEANLTDVTVPRAEQASADD